MGLATRQSSPKAKSNYSSHTSDPSPTLQPADFFTKAFPVHRHQNKFPSLYLIPQSLSPPFSWPMPMPPNLNFPQLGTLSICLLFHQRHPLSYRALLHFLRSTIQTIRLVRPPPPSPSDYICSRPVRFLISPSVCRWCDDKSYHSVFSSIVNLRPCLYVYVIIHIPHPVIGIH